MDPAKSEIESAVTRLTNAVSDSHMQLEGLAKRIEPVLGVPIEEAPHDALSTSSSLGGRLHALATEAETLVTRLRNMVDRVQL